MSTQPYPFLSVDSKATKAKLQSGRDVEEGRTKKGGMHKQVKYPMATTQDAMRNMQHGGPWLGFCSLLGLAHLSLSSSLALYVCLSVCLPNPVDGAFFAPI